MNPMWTNEREIARIFSNQLRYMIDELSACQDKNLLKVSQELSEIQDKLEQIHMSAKSRQTSPKEL